MEKKKSRWFRWQRGQAMAEYWVTIPAGVFIMLGAMGAVNFIINSLTQTLTGLNEGALTCENLPEEETEGPEVAQLDCHIVQLAAHNYNEETDRTTVAYRVTSGCDPSISHWSLGLGRGVADRILSSSEPYEWGTDPTTGVTGIKFDTGYGGGKEAEEPETPKAPKTPGGKKTSSFISLVSSRLQSAETDSRTILLTMGGYFDWEIVDLGLKAGTESYVSQITAPVASAEPPSDEDQECGLE